MSKSCMGAIVRYCGHNGWFVADIFEVDGANVVYANGPVTPDNLIRNRMGEITHVVSDFPRAGVWKPERGVFVVPASQVQEITEGIKKMFG